MGKIKIGADAVFAAVFILLTERVSVFFIYLLCALLHEAGHLAAAKWRGIEIKEIRIGMAGARICTYEGAGSYLDEFLLCAAGPLVNVIIVVIGILASLAFEIPEALLANSAERFLLSGEWQVQGALTFFVLCAAVQGIVNLAPVKTLDGGRLLYCAIASVSSQRVAERVVGAAGAFCVFIIWSAALFLMLKTGEGLGIYVFCAGLFLTTLRDRDLVEN